LHTAGDFELEEFILGQANFGIKLVEDEFFKVVDVSDITECGFVWSVEVAD
jgi:hypothetical protein